MSQSPRTLRSFVHVPWTRRYNEHDKLARAQHDKLIPERADLALFPYWELQCARAGMYGNCTYKPTASGFLLNVSNKEQVAIFA